MKTFLQLSIAGLALLSLGCSANPGGPTAPLPNAEPASGDAPRDAGTSPMRSVGEPVNPP